jgi:hypothetical protein
MKTESNDKTTHQADLDSLTELLDEQIAGLRERFLPLLGIAYYKGCCSGLESMSAISDRVEKAQGELIKELRTRLENDTPPATGE